MTKESLLKLKRLSKNLSILHIEEDKILQNEIGVFLERLFDIYWQAFDGEEGIESFKNNKPSIVITSLTMQKKEGLDLLIELKEIDENAKIIVLSDKCDDFKLLETLDFGLVDLLSKPYDLNQLLDSLLLGISQTQDQNVDDRALKDIEKAMNSLSNVVFCTNYKGVSIRDKGKIIGTDKKGFRVWIPSKTYLAAKNSFDMTLKLEDEGKYITSLISELMGDGKMELVAPHYVSPILFEKKTKMIKIDKTFKAGIYFKNEVIEDTRILEISHSSVLIYVPQEDLNLKMNDRLDMKFGVEIQKHNFEKEKKMTVVFAMGQVLKKERFRKGWKLTMILRPKASSKSTLLKYLKQREMEIIMEFREMLKNFG